MRRDKITAAGQALGVSVVSRATVATEIKLRVLVAVPLEPRLSRMKQIAAAAWSRTA